MLSQLLVEYPPSQCIYLELPKSKLPNLVIIKPQPLPTSILVYNMKNHKSSRYSHILIEYKMILLKEIGVQIRIRNVPPNTKFILIVYNCAYNIDSHSSKRYCNSFYYKIFSKNYPQKK